MLTIIIHSDIMLGEIMLCYSEEGCNAYYSYLSVFILSVTKLSVIILIVIMLFISMRVPKLSIPMAECIIIQSVILPSIIALSVMVPILNSTHSPKKISVKDLGFELGPRPALSNL